MTEIIYNVDNQYQYNTFQSRHVTSPLSWLFSYLSQHNLSVYIVIIELGEFPRQSGALLLKNKHKRRAIRNLSIGIPLPTDTVPISTGVFWSNVDCFKDRLFCLVTRGNALYTLPGIACDYMPTCMNTLPHFKGKEGRVGEVTHLLRLSDNSATDLSREFLRFLRFNQEGDQRGTLFYHRGANPLSIKSGRYGCQTFPCFSVSSADQRRLGNSLLLQ